MGMTRRDGGTCPLCGKDLFVVKSHEWKAVVSRLKKTRKSAFLKAFRDYVQKRVKAKELSKDVRLRVYACTHAECTFERYTLEEVFVQTDPFKRDTFEWEVGPWNSTNS